MIPDQRYDAEMNLFDLMCRLLGCATLGAGLVWLLFISAQILRWGYKGRDPRSWPLVRRLLMVLVHLPLGTAAIMVILMFFIWIRPSPIEFGGFATGFVLCWALCWRFGLLYLTPRVGDVPSN